MRLLFCRIDRLFPSFCGHRISAVILFTLLLSSCQDGGSPPAAGGTTSPSITWIPFATIATLPHDTTSFTEGFLFHDGQLYESTAYVEEVPGSHSWFGTVDPHTGKISPRVELPPDQYFGEGICFLKDKVYQLTYKERLGFVYDGKTFKKLGTFTPPGREGWGMTTDGQSLLISDGTSTIYFMDPVTFRTTRTISVTENDVPPDSLNELEFIKGSIYANRYRKDYIARIDPASGKVLGRLDCTSLVSAAKNKYPGSLELNGIAYDSTGDKIYITGKCWPDIYSIRFSH